MEKAARLLMQLGLTKYESRVYAALVKGGESKVGLIQAVSGVPRAAVYGTLGRLEARSLVDRGVGNPARFRAVPPGVVLRRIRADVDSAAAAALKGLSRLRQAAPPSQRRLLWIAEGEGALAERLSAGLARARREILILGHPRVMRRFEADLGDAASRGVRVSYLAPAGGGARARRTGGRRPGPGASSLGPAKEFVAGAVDGRAVFYGARDRLTEVFAWSEDPPFVRLAFSLLGGLSRAGTPSAARPRRRG